ncbi:NAD(P)H-dependent flavin oxidoreductase [Klebsiella pneumoniae]|uniref:NAD(P)H-dependent flavin oxidoreductase n=1 Tax=Klebsiella pneumoniae TaxID=573 RepID=UPI001F4DFB66|nr:nitronate monooxygenase [Klebsiella pneumoniae]MCH9378686.1 nitronate monooxygenase [Klebsiella pneumoniae]MCH9485776.1 nitronate monooxygenase [Klebsiella pneumoniae]
MQPNRVARILGIEKPVVQGPLSWLTDARLVAAVGNAGGLGVLGPNAGLTAATAVSTPEATAEKMREEIRKTKQLTEKPFGVNLIPTAENDIWTPAILPLIVDAVQRVPVMAAGGITDARGARAVHALGAEGVFAGSVFISTIESRLPDSVKAKIVAANGLDLRLFRTLPDYYRALPGKLSDTLVAMDRAGASRTELAQAMGGLRGMRLGMLEGNTDEGYISVGAGIGNIHAITSVAEVVNQLAV